MASISAAGAPGTPSTAVATVVDWVAVAPSARTVTGKDPVLPTVVFVSVSTLGAGAIVELVKVHVT